MVNKMQKQKIVHYPNLKTVIMVEDVLKSAGDIINREQIKKNLPNKIMHQTLNIILRYLEESGKIIDGRKGIVWIHNRSKKLEEAISSGVEL
jgi:ribosomal protein S8